jgi:hypothetical protein
MVYNQSLTQKCTEPLTEKQVSEKKVSVVVAGHVVLEPVLGGPALAGAHQPGVVDQDVETGLGRVDLLGKRADGLEGSQVEPLDHHVLLRSLRLAQDLVCEQLNNLSKRTGEKKKSYQGGKRENRRDEI